MVLSLVNHETLAYIFLVATVAKKKKKGKKKKEKRVTVQFLGWPSGADADSLDESSHLYKRVCPTIFSIKIIWAVQL